jgi:hypothetical protein
MRWVLVSGPAQKLVGATATALHTARGGAPSVTAFLEAVRLCQPEGFIAMGSSVTLPMMSCSHQD